MGKKFINTFTEGLDRDVSVNKYGNKNVFACENFRVVSHDELSTGALYSLKGTLAKQAISGTGYELIGSCELRDWIILFVYTAPGGKIYKFKDGGADGPDAGDTFELIYESATINFDPVHPIKAIGRYENEQVQKIYFTDGYSFFYHLNIVNNNDTNPLPNGVPLESLEILSNIEFQTMLYSVITGGNLKSGRVQYAYQLYNVSGAESLFSPASSLINITDSDDVSSTSYGYLGTEKGKVVNKSVKLTIPIIGNTYRRLRLVALEYEDFNIEPAIRIVGEYNISGMTSISPTDYGQTIGTLTLEEFRFIQSDYIPQTLDTKNNHLFIGNLKEEYFDIPFLDDNGDILFDSRAFRFNSSRVANLNGEFTIDGTNLSAGITPATEKYACFNPFNDLDNDTAIPFSSGYKFQSDGTTLGGEGLHVKYEFITRQVLIDNYPSVDDNTYVTTSYGYPQQKVEVSNSIDAGYASYANAAEYVGYQRDEIYSFALTFYDKKGRQSFAKWIGDVRFPNPSEPTFPLVTTIPVDDSTAANVLGIKFTVTIPQALIDDYGVTSYQIVRCERDDANKTVKAAGLVGFLLNFSSNGNVLDLSSTGVPASLYSMSQATPQIMDTFNTSAIANVSSAQAFIYPGDGDLNKNVIEFTSPEIAFNRKMSTSQDDFITISGYLDNHSYTGVRDLESSVSAQSIMVSMKYKNSGAFVPIGATSYFETRANLTSSKILPQITSSLENSYVLSSDKTYRRTAYGVGRAGLRGIHLIAEASSNFNLGSYSSDSGNYKVPYGYYKQNKGIGIYGGTDYSSRLGRTYYKCSSVVPVATSTVDVYGGDTYIGYHIEYRSMLDPGRPEGEWGFLFQYISVIMYPVESTINLSLRLDDVQRYINWTAHIDEPNSLPDFSSGLPKYQIQEKESYGKAILAALDGYEGASTEGLYPEELGDLYRYNNAYSCMDKSKVFIPEPFDFVNIQTYDTRVRNSELKSNGEYIDSWLKFKPNNYLDVDAQYGPLTRIINNGDKIYFIQPTGVGILSVKDRTLIKDTNARELVLGTGGVLARYDYLTFVSGSTHYEGIISTDHALYYVDSKRKRIYALSGDEQPISAIKGINSLLHKLTYTKVLAGFDKSYNEVYFTIDNTTLAYNEFQQAFLGTRSFVPDHYISGTDRPLYTARNYGSEVPLLANDITNVLWTDSEDDYILVSDATTGATLFKHDVGTGGEYYGTGSGVGSEAFVELIINPEGNGVCSFTNLDFRMEVLDANGNEVYTESVVEYKPLFSTIKQVVFTNSYMTSTVDVVYGTNIKKIGKVWRMQVPLVADRKVASRSTRFVDTYLKVKIIFDNTTVNRLRLHDVITYYDSVQV